MRRIILVLGVCVLVFLALYRQPYYPITWFDEGLVLQGAINLSQHGQYAMRSVEGFRVLDQPLTANGPGIVLPISAVFAVFGIGLLQARLVMVVYLIVAVLLFYKVSELMWGGTAALISTLALLAVPDEGFLLYGRQALGNVPALAYFLAGCYFFILLASRKNNLFACLAGLFWGITLVTKSQYWIIVPVLVIVAFLDLIYYKQIGLRSALVMIVFTVGLLLLWQFAQYLIIGRENYGQYIESVRSSAKETVFAFRAMRIPGNIWYLIRSGFALFIVPGLLLAGFESLRRQAYSLVQAFLILFVTAWSAWYIFVSVGWHRYAFEPYSIGMVFFGLACIRAFEFIRPFIHSATGFSWRIHWTKLAAGSFLIVSCLWGLILGIKQIQRILVAPVAYPQQFAKYLHDNIQSGAVIESWEWEIDALTPELTYHHPTNDWVDRKTAELQFGEVSNEKYSFWEFHPSYLIDGPFSKWTGIYKIPLANGCCVKLTDVGGYTLYKVIKRVSSLGVMSSLQKHGMIKLQ